MGGVSAMVMGILTGSSALLPRSASVSAPPLDATSSIVRLRGGRSGPSCRTSLGQRGRAASRRTSSRAAGPGAGAGEASSPTATLGEMPPAEDGFDVDVVVDGDVQAGDRGAGDGDVDADGHLAVLLHELLDPARERHGRRRRGGGL